VKPKRSTSSSGKRSEALYQELTVLAKSLLIEVRQEKLLREVGYHVRSGGCRLNGRDLVLLDSQVPLADRVDALMEEIARHGMEDPGVSPELRQLLERTRRRLGLEISSKPSSLPKEEA
jgi:hypothetical protein